MTEINNSIQKLAEEKYPLKLTKDLTPNELEEVMSENFIQLKRREGFIAGYKAALSSTESREVYVPVSVEEKPTEDNWYTLVAPRAIDIRCWYDSVSGWEIVPKTEANAYKHWLKKTVLTVVRDGDCGTSKEQSGSELWDIKYHSTYSVWDQRMESFLANSEDDALNQFWEGKNKEGCEIMSVNKR